MEGVTGSIPVAPTIQSPFSRSLETWRLRPPLAGISGLHLWLRSLWGSLTAHLGPWSPRRKFPFLVPRSCLFENVTFELSLVDMILNCRANGLAASDVGAVQAALIDTR
jgi:hypothetical protein